MYFFVHSVLMYFFCVFSFYALDRDTFVDKSVFIDLHTFAI